MKGLNIVPLAALLAGAPLAASAAFDEVNTPNIASVTTTAEPSAKFSLAGAFEADVSAPGAINVGNSVANAPTTNDPGAKIDGRHWTFWLGGPFGIEYRPAGAKSAFSFSLGLAGVLSNASSSSPLGSSSLSNVKAGLMGEALYYPNHKGSGLAYNLRVGTGNGIYAAPGIFYVSRPRGSIVGRVGLMFPIGGGAIPVYPEAGIGFRF